MTNKIRQVAIVVAMVLGASVTQGADGELSKKAAARRLSDWPNLEEVIIVTKCHLDVGYTHTVPELVKLYRTSYMDKALALFDSDRTMPPDLRVRWTLPAWLTDAILNGPYSPERRYKTWLAYYMRGDNAGPMSRKEVDNILRKARQQLPGIKVRFGDPDEFADAIIAEEKAHPSLPVVRGDMPDTWIHGMMTLPEATAIHRRTTGDLVTLGQLDTTLRAFGVATEPVAELLERAYRDSGLYSEHTWGLAGFRVRGPRLYRPGWRQRYDSGEYKEFDESFQYHADYARRACKAAQDGIQARMEALAQSVAVEGPRVVVFNPLPYVRDAVVEVEMPEGGRLGEASLPNAVREGNKVRFLAKGLPAGGYKTYVVHGEQVKHVENQNDLHVLHGQIKKIMGRWAALCPPQPTDLYCSGRACA